MANTKILWNDRIFEVKLENLSGKAEPRQVMVNGEPKDIVMKSDGSPKIIRRSPEGKDVEFARMAEGGDIISEVSNVYIDEDKEPYTEGDLSHYYLTVEGNEIPATKNEKVDAFELTSFEPVQNYLDKYQMEKYYQVLPYQGTSKSTIQQRRTMTANTVGMKALWEYLHQNQLVGKGILNVTSAGWMPNIAYVRAVLIDENKWTLEVAMFKQRKQFTWIEEMNYEPTQQPEEGSQVVGI